MARTNPAASGFSATSFSDRIALTRPTRWTDEQDIQDRLEQQPQRLDRRARSRARLRQAQFGAPRPGRLHPGPGPGRCLGRRAAGAHGPAHRRPDRFRRGHGDAIGRQHDGAAEHGQDGHQLADLQRRQPGLRPLRAALRQFRRAQPRAHGGPGPDLRQPQRQRPGVPAGPRRRGVRPLGAGRRRRPHGLVHEPVRPGLPGRQLPAHRRRRRRAQLRRTGRARRRLRRPGGRHGREQRQHRRPRRPGGPGRRPGRAPGTRRQRPDLGRGRRLGRRQGGEQGPDHRRRRPRHAHRQPRRRGPRRGHQPGRRGARQHPHGQERRDLARRRRRRDPRRRPDAGPRQPAR